MAARWLAQDAEIPLAEARARVPAQDDQSALAASLEKRLGENAAGSDIDQETGELVVNVRDAAGALTVRSEGAVPAPSPYTGAAAFDGAHGGHTRRCRPGSSSVDPVANRAVLTVPADRVAVVSAKVKDLRGVAVQGTTALVTTQANVYRLPADRVRRPRLLARLQRDQGLGQRVHYRRHCAEVPDLAIRN